MQANSWKRPSVETATTKERPGTRPGIEMFDNCPPGTAEVMPMTGQLVSVKDLLNEEMSRPPFVDPEYITE